MQQCDIMFIESSARIFQWVAIMEGDKASFTRCEDLLAKSEVDTQEGIYQSEDGKLRLYLNEKKNLFNLSSYSEEYVRELFRFCEPVPHKDCVQPRDAILELSRPETVKSPLKIHFASKLARELGIVVPRKLPLLLRVAALEEKNLYPFLRMRKDIPELGLLENQDVFCQTVHQLKDSFMNDDLSERLLESAWKEPLDFVDHMEAYLTNLFGFHPAYNGGRTLRTLLAEMHTWFAGIMTLPAGQDRDFCLRTNASFFSKELETAFKKVGKRNRERYPLMENNGRHVAPRVA